MPDTLIWNIDLASGLYKIVKRRGGVGTGIEENIGVVT